MSLDSHVIWARSSYLFGSKEGPIHRFVLADLALSPSPGTTAPTPGHPQANSLAKFSRDNIEHENC